MNRIRTLAWAGAAAFASAASAAEVWLEAEDFKRPGAWRVDTQFTHKMGSAYLIAPGVLKPIGAAATEIELPEAGGWTAWARTKDWVPAHHPGRFALSVDGRRTPGELGASGRAGWIWEKAGAFKLAAGAHSIALEDLSGAYARCDALLFTTDASFRPPDDYAETERLRARLAPQPPESEKGPFDVVVVGGGPAGVCAAVAAARNGAKTALVHDRPVLGGNCSDELGVGTDGASNHQPNGRESGLVEEWNLLDPNRGGHRLSAAAALLTGGETNLVVLLNERVTGAVSNADGRIAAVLARNTRTGRRTRVAGRLFVDATGDGWVGYYAGAKYRFGREAQAEFNEPKSHMPEKADALTMSGCLCSYAYEMRETPVAYETPAWADVLPPGFDRPVASLAMPWWLEHPNDLDDLADAEEARDELLRYNFAYWGWLKNKSKLASRAKNAELVSVPIVNGRRESRRLVGDYVLNANDLVAGRVFPDAVCHGGWGLDVHDVLGMKRPAGNGWQGNPIPVPTYSIPFRSLYSANVPNLLMAGRCLSATHLALGSARVGATCAVTGQAAGTAAALCRRYGLTPRELGAQRISELQQTLLKDDQYVPGVLNRDPLDFARDATVDASSASCWQSFHPPNWAPCPKGVENGPNGTKLAVDACAFAVVDGVTRIVGNKAHAWVSSEELPQWISLTFDEPKTISEVRITFDTDLSLPFAEFFPKTLVKDYELEVLADGAWWTVAEETGNARRLRVHRFSPVKADAVRLTVKATHGLPEARVFEIRVY